MMQTGRFNEPGVLGVDRGRFLGARCTIYASL